MSNKDNRKMGTDPLAWINQEPEQAEPVKPEKELRQKQGRPRTIYREYEKSSQEGLQDNFTRATFIVREDLLKKLKDYAYTERKTLKDIVNDMLQKYLDGKEIIERDDE